MKSEGWIGKIKVLRLRCAQAWFIAGIFSILNLTHYRELHGTNGMTWFMVIITGMAFLLAIQDLGKWNYWRKGGTGDD